MPSTWSYYRSLDDGEAEELTQQHGHPCIEGEMYNSQEYGDSPAWVEVTLKDEGVLMMKMARGLVNDFEDFHAIQLRPTCLEITVSEDWGGYSDAHLKIYARQAWINFYAKHSNEMLEVNVTDQFNQAIGV